MANERDDEKFGENQASGSQGQQRETGRQDDQAKGLGEQPAASGQTQPSGGSDTMTTEGNAEGASGGSNPTGEGFVGSQGKDSSDYLQEKGKTDGDIKGTSEQPPLDGE